MAASIKTLPIAEKWECTACGICCRGNVVSLNDEDLRKLREQRWGEHEEYRGVRVAVRKSRFSNKYRLAQRNDGRCVFLGGDGRCRIHAEYGHDAKPLICRMYPLQLVPQGKRVVLTLRRSCPTAVVDEGRSLVEHMNKARRLVAEGKLLDKTTRPPQIIRGHPASWDVFLQVSDVLEKLLTSDRYPLVRRVVHALKFCELLEQARLKRIDRQAFGELLTILAEGCSEETTDVFRQRVSPSNSAGALFRQTAAQYVRLHSRYEVQENWSERWRLTRASLALARGKGKVPRLHDFLAETTFDALEQPLGHLPPEIQRPFTRYFEVNGATKQYAIAVRPGWTLVESFRATALAYASALWILRWCSTGRQPTAEDAVEMVTIIDRGQGYAPLTGGQHRGRIRTLARLGELERIVAWYAS